MSDPMTNAEVEDVLSSIRRLVSEEKPVEQAPPADEVPSTATPDRLVLTPSLRVTEDEQPPETEEVEAHHPEEDEPEVTFSHYRNGDEHRPEPEDEAPEPPDETWPDHPQWSAVGTEPASAPEWGAVREQDNTQVDAATFDAADLDMGAHPGQTEDPAAEEPASTDDAARADDAAEVYAEAYAADAVTEGVDAEATETHVAENGAYPEHLRHEDDAAARATLSAKIAALETLVAGRRDEWEPDDPGTDAYAGTDAPAMEWEDADTAPAAVFHRSPEVEAEATDDAERGESQIFSRDEDVLDEEALRDLVADIVREELQGALGERITRNVRKLVRREIHRALAAQELE